jgi:Fur family transcriptional regulator, ferric uptake regulator
MIITIKMQTPRDSAARSLPAASGGGGAGRVRAARAAVEQLEAFIERRGLKHSRQREVILETFLAMGGHVPVEALVSRVREQDPRVGAATVYRTMKLLADSGLAVQRQFGDGQTRYEPAHGGGHHDHLICTGCGRIVEFENERIEELQLRVARSHGFEVQSHKLEMYGRCAACRRGKGGAPKETAT